MRGRECAFFLFGRFVGLCEGGGGGVREEGLGICWQLINHLDE